MRDTPDPRNALRMPDAVVAEPSSAGDGLGWYLYGIVGAGDPTISETLRAAGSGKSAASGASGETGGATDDERPLEALTSDGLMAIVRRVPLADYAVETLRERAEDTTWIEAAARRHNAVIEAIHSARTVLPAQFGAVYPRAEDVRAALLEERDALLERLAWLDGCDEWGVRLYGDGAALRQAAAGQENVQRLRADLASAGRGRAYLLERKLADELALATERLVDNLIGAAYDQMGRHAKAHRLNRRLAGGRLIETPQTYAPQESLEGAQPVELAYATFLTPRAAARDFIADVRAFPERQPGVWIEYSGPWPPYSFTSALDPEQAQPDRQEQQEG